MNGTNVRIENSRKQSRFKEINSEKTKYMKTDITLSTLGKSMLICLWDIYCNELQ